MSIFGKIVKGLFIFIISFYQKFISPLLPSACIYKPTCSIYTKEAIVKFGALKGTILGFLRIIRCNALFIGGDDNLTDDLTIADALKRYKEFFRFRKN